MFSQELIWSGDICYTNIVVSSLILKMRSEDAPLENDVFHCIFIWLHGNICVLTYPEISLFFSRLWPFVIKIISAFKRSVKEVCRWSMQTAN